MKSEIMWYYEALENASKLKSKRDFEERLIDLCGQVCEDERLSRKEVKEFIMDIAKRFERI